MSHKKFGPDRFSRFDVYWIQTNKQTDRQTDKPNFNNILCYNIKKYFSQHPHFADLKLRKPHILFE